MSSHQSFTAFAESVDGYDGVVLSLDPGETTGWAVFDKKVLKACGQFPSASITQAWNHCVTLIMRHKFVVNDSALKCCDSDSAAHNNTPWFPPIKAGGRADFSMVIEDYRVYSFKANDHKFSSVYTVKVLAVYELLAAMYNIPVKLTLAHPAKKFVTDNKLRAWGFWQTGERHARDAIRHGAYYIVQNSLGAKSSPKNSFNLP